MNKNHYEILGISQNATQEEIKKAYRECAKKYHPDENNISNANVIFDMIKQSYDVLSNSIKKNEYDLKLATFDLEETKSVNSNFYEENYKPKNANIIFTIGKIIFKIILLPVVLIFMLLGFMVAIASVFLNIIGGIIVFVMTIQFFNTLYNYLYHTQTLKFTIEDFVLTSFLIIAYILFLILPDLLTKISSSLLNFVLHK